MSGKTENSAEARERGQFISRELSWLAFNMRVLDEAGCAANPLLERLKFIAICSSNLDEFFMVRIAGLRQMVQLGRDLPDPAGIRPSEQLRILRRRIEKLLRRQHELLYDKLLPELAAAGIRLRSPAELPPTARQELTRRFRSQILPVLTPLAVDEAHPFPLLSNGAIEIAVSLRTEVSEEPVHAFVEVPEVLPRFLSVDDGEPGQCFVLLEEVIMSHLEELFSGCSILDFFPFRLTRDMDFSVESEGIDDLMRTIEQKLLQRRRREPIRLELLRSARGPLARWLQRALDLDDLYRYEIAGHLNYKQLFELVGKVNRPELLEAPWPPVLPPEFQQQESGFQAIAEHGTILIAPPFHSFNPIVRLLEEAAEDPGVLAIKQTLYRVSGNSPVVRALQRAAENGKQVTVVVELKARFDENNNIQWARRLEESGAHVVYGISDLKIHCKALLIVRRENGLIRRYLHLATGNYNDKTATMYTDMGIMSCDPDLAYDVAGLFNVMTGYSAPPERWRKIAAAPFDLRARLLQLIDREKRIAAAGGPGRIIAKMNSLVDPEIIRHLHAAARAGVEIDLIVRGICCLKPESGRENLRVISIVDRYLEHTRIFYFFNEGEAEYFLASADWMYRNLDRRIELMFPIEDPAIRRTLDTVLSFQLEDREKGRRLLGSGRYTRRLPETHTPERSQCRTYRYFRDQAEDARVRQTGDILPVFTRPEGKE